MPEHAVSSAFLSPFGGFLIVTSHATKCPKNSRTSLSTDIYLKIEMSSSALHDAQNDADNIARPRAVKPGNPMVLRAMSEEGAIKANPTLETPHTDGSRSLLHLPTSRGRLTSQAAAVRHHFLPTLPLRFSLYPQLESMCGHRSNTGCFRLSNIPHEYRTSTQRVNIPISGVSLFYSGSV